MTSASLYSVYTLNSPVVSATVEPHMEVRINENAMDRGGGGILCFTGPLLLLLSSCALYLVNPFIRTFSPSSSKNSSKAGLPSSIGYGIRIHINV